MSRLDYEPQQRNHVMFGILVGFALGCISLGLAFMAVWLMLHP